MRDIPSREELQNIIEAVRKLVEGEKENGLKCSTSDEFLVRFIRASQYDVNISFSLVKQYFKSKLEDPEVFVLQNPSQFLSILTRRDLGLPLKVTDKCGRRVFHLRFGMLDPDKDDFTAMIQAAVIALEAFSLEEDVQINGVNLLFTFENLSYKILKWATPHKLRISMAFFQDCIPIRFDAIHLARYPYFFNFLYSSIFKPFLYEETRKKIVWHRNISSLEQYIEKESLPEDLGGQFQPEDGGNWYKMVLEKESVYSELREMGYSK